MYHLLMGPVVLEAFNYNVYNGAENLTYTGFFPCKKESIYFIEKNGKVKNEFTKIKNGIYLLTREENYIKIKHIVFISNDEYKELKKFSLNPFVLLN